MRIKILKMKKKTKKTQTKMILIDMHLLVVKTGNFGWFNKGKACYGIMYYYLFIIDIISCARNIIEICYSCFLRISSRKLRFWKISIFCYNLTYKIFLLTIKKLVSFKKFESSKSGKNC